MGLFDSIKGKKEQKVSISGQKAKVDDLGLAEALLSTFFLSTKPIDEEYKDQVEAILNASPSRQDTFNKIIELCGGQETPRQRYILAKTYAMSNAALRDKAIEYIELYINNPLYEKAYLQYHHSLGNKQFTPKEEENIHLSSMYSDLGKAYEGKDDLDKALDCYRKEHELTPFWPAPFCHISSALTKKNMLNEAMQTYLEAKSSPYYEPFEFKTAFGSTYVEDTFKIAIDKHITELQEKIDKGYVYKPRKAKDKSK